PVVLGERELDERVLVVPAEELPERLAERVADRWGEVDPTDQGNGRVEDQGHGEVEPPPAVEPEVPRRDAVSIGPGQRCEPELAEPALDIRRAHHAARLRRRHGGQSTVSARSEQPGGWAGACEARPPGSVDMAKL